MPTIEEDMARLKELEAKSTGAANVARDEKRLAELEAISFSSQVPRATPMEMDRLAVLEDKEKSSALEYVEDTLKHVAAQAFKPLKRTAQIYGKERDAGRSAVAKGIDTASGEQSVWERVKNIGLGTAQYTLSPLTAFAKGGVNEPIVEALYEGVGVPKGAAEFVGKLGEEAVYFVPIGGTIKMAMLAKEPGVKAALQLARAKPYKTAVQDTTKIREQIDAAIAPELKTEGAAKSFTRPQVKQEIVNDITKGAEEALAGNIDESKRIFKQISERLALKEISIESLPEILQKNNITPVEFAKMYEETVSTAGRMLGYHGRAAKALNFAFKDSPEALAILQKAYKKEVGEVYLIDKALDMYANVDNFRRAMLVGQVATSVRNAWSQVGRLSISSLDEALQGALRGTVGAEGKTLEQTMQGLNPVISAISRMTPTGRKRLLNVLDANNSVLSKMRLFNQPVHEVQLSGKIANAVNVLNRTQEFYFRRVGFEAKLRELLARKGMDFNTINPKHIPEGVLEESVNYALEMTFAASPKSKGMQDFVRRWTKLPGMTLINPFPRFNFANAIPFIYEHSPLGYLNAVRPSVLKDLASGNPDKFAKSASRATVGSLMMDQAFRLRQSKYAGERWYEIKVGDEKDGTSKVIDTRAFAPFSTYLFLAEHFVNPERIKPIDYAGAFVGLNRAAGSSLVVLDWVRAKTGESFKKQLGNFVGQYASSFAVPLRTATDIYGAIDPEENKFRDYRESPLIAPLIMNIPKISQIVPEKPSPVKSGPPVKSEAIDIGGVKIPGGAFRQLTGLGVRKKTPIQKEIDAVGLEWQNILPRTGVPRADRSVSRYMAPMVEKLLPKIINNDRYKDLTIVGKRLVLAKAFGEIKRQAKLKMQLADPNLALQVEVERQNAGVKELLKTESKQQGAKK